MEKIVRTGMNQEIELAKKLPEVKSTKEKYLASKAQLHDGISN